MSTAYHVRSSRVQPEGNQMPFTDGIAANRQIEVIRSGKLDMVNAVAEQGAQMIPANATVLGVRIRVRTQLGTGAALVKVGKQGDDDWICSESVAISKVAGDTIDATLLHTALEAGDVLTFAGDGGATSTGDVDVIVVLAYD